MQPSLIIASHHDRFPPQETICSRDLGKLSALIGRLIGASLPIAFWTGYNEVVLVSSQYVDEWSVVLAQDDTSCARAFPRRWLDIHGRRMNDIWDAACRAAVGTVLLHPAVSQVRHGSCNLRGLIR